MTASTRRLRLKRYPAFDGPKIVLFGPLEADFTELRQAFIDLSEGARNVRVDLLPFVVREDDVKIVAAPLPVRHPNPAMPGLFAVGDDSYEYEWIGSHDDWRTLADLTESVCLAGEPCHQYLSHYPGNDATVVISKGEYC